MQEIDRSSRNGSTPGSNTMSNLQVKMPTNMPVAGPSQSGISVTSYQFRNAPYKDWLHAIEHWFHVLFNFSFCIMYIHTCGILLRGDLE